MMVLECFALNQQLFFLTSPIYMCFQWGAAARHPWDLVTITFQKMKGSGTEVQHALSFSPHHLLGEIREVSTTHNHWVWTTIVQCVWEPLGL